MRKMKKILAWLTVLTVNVSMMPMPTVAAATATDASTALNEETITSDATKEATQAQETAKKAVESATKNRNEEGREQIKICSFNTEFTGYD